MATQQKNNSPKEENGTLKSDQKKKKQPTANQIGKKEKNKDSKKRQIIELHLGTSRLPLTDAKAVLDQIEQLKSDEKYSEALGFLHELFRKLQTLQDGEYSRIEIDIMVRQYQDFTDGFQYILTSKPIGCCLLISNNEFYQVPGCPKSKKLPPRPGAENDVKRLENLMSTIGFKVIRKENLKRWEIEREITAMAKADNKKYDCFVCIISSHGTSTRVYGSDGYDLMLGPQLKLFKSDVCPDLAGKPKIFLSQLCNIDNDGEKGQESKQPLINEADFLCGYSTLPGYLAYDSKGDKMGSFYLNLLWQHLKDKYKACDLVAILEEINSEMAKKKTEYRPNDLGSVTMFVDCLRGHLFFQ